MALFTVGKFVFETSEKCWQGSIHLDQAQIKMRRGEYTKLLISYQIQADSDLTRGWFGRLLHGQRCLQQYEEVLSYSASRIFTMVRAQRRPYFFRYNHDTYVRLHLSSVHRLVTK